MSRKRSRFDRLMLPTLAAGAVATLGLSQAAHAVPIAYGGGTYSETFNTLNATGSGTGLAWTNESTLPGWSLFRQPAAAPVALTTYGSDDGGNNAGSFYSYGLDSSGDRALGGLGSGGAYYGSPTAGNPAGWIAVAIQNQTGGTVNQFSVSYDGEQWRNGGNTTPHTMTLEYGFGASFNSVASWTAAGAGFNFTSPVATATAAQLDGNAPANRVAGLGGTVGSLTWNNNDTLWLRWVETENSGNDHGLAVDNFLFSTGVITPPPAPGNAVLPTAGQTLTIGFGGFTGAGFAPVPAAGQLDSDNWRINGLSDALVMNFGETRTTGDFARGLGGITNVSAGGVYAFDHGGSDIGLGVQPSTDDFTPGFVELRLQNTTGGVVDALSVMYDAWVRNNEDRSNSFNFSYSLDGTLFTPVPAADLTSTAALDTAGWTLFSRSVFLGGLALANNGFVYLRWSGDDVGGSGSRDEFALDNVRITNATAAPVPEPATLGLLGVAGLALVNRRRKA